MVAIAIPVFTTQLERSRESTDAANVRSAYAEVVTNYLTEHDATFTIDVESRQGQAGWQDEQPEIVYQGGGADAQASLEIPASTKAGGTYTVGITIDATNGAATPTITFA